MLRGKYFLVLFITLSFSFAAPAQEQFAFRISFTDKAGSPGLGNPLLLLTQRALDRRAAQGITLDDLDRPVSPDYIDSVLTNTGGKMHLCSRWLNHCVILVDDSADILTLQGKSFITDIKYVGYYPVGLHNKGNPGGKFENEIKTNAKITADPNYYGTTWNQTHLVYGECLHDQGWKGAGKLIAVIDDGFQFVNIAPAFDSLIANNAIADHYNFVKADTPVFGFSGHGTLVLSTMVGYIPNTYVGAAPEAEYALYIAEDQTSEQPIEMDNMVAAMERADSVGTDVISSSLGYNIFTWPVYYPLDYATEMDGKTTIAAKGVNVATQKGILVVISVGNEGDNSWHYMLTPGDADSALTIGSVTTNAVPASNSGYGPNSAGQVKPDVCVQGSPASVMLSGPIPTSGSGTSFATPELAGFAACLWQARPTRNAYQMRLSIQQSAHLYAAPDAHFGYGIPNFCTALYPVNVPDFEGDETKIVSYPNPFTNELYLSVYTQKTEQVHFSLVDLNGRKVFESSYAVKAGTNKIYVSIPNELAAGVYFSKVVVGDVVKMEVMSRM